MDSRLILALDGMSMAAAIDVAKLTRDYVWGFKMNDLLVDEGIVGAKRIAEIARVMWDPKLFDIPNTMTNYLKKYKAAGAEIVTVHARAKYRAPEEFGPMLAGVTVLTSDLEEDLKEDICACVYSNECGDVDLHPDIITRLVKHYTHKMIMFGYGHIVCSAQIVKHTKGFNIKKICPAIRPRWSIVEGDDQNPDLIATPKQAILNGATYLVIGRPIMKAPDILEAIHKTNAEVEEALIHKTNAEVEEVIKES